MKDFIPFLEACPTPWHTTDYLSKRLKKAGAKELREQKPWSLQNGQTYFCVRSGTLIAFKLPKKALEKAVIVASHTDSPSLKLKHHAPYVEEGCEYLRAEPYGGISPIHWFDRDLMIAGRIFTAKGEKLVSFADQCATIPSLPPHLKGAKERDENKVDRQKQLAALFSLKPGAFNALFKPAKPLASDLLLIPAEKPQHVGAHQELISAYRLDNLSSVYASLMAFEKSAVHEHLLNMAIFWNHEEIGSGTREGAASELLGDLLKRIRFCLGYNEEYDYILKSKSLILSVDVSQAYHPSHADCFDPGHHNPLGQGVAFKFDANLSYATDAEVSAPLFDLCKKHKIAHQIYARHSNIRCGSTVGPKMALSGIPVADIGIPLASMHATRELAAIADIKSLIKLLSTCIM